MKIKIIEANIRNGTIRLQISNNNENDDDCVITTKTYYRPSNPRTIYSFDKCMSSVVPLT